MLLPRAKPATRISARTEELVMEVLIPQPGAGSISGWCQQPQQGVPVPGSVCGEDQYQGTPSAAGKAAEQL